MEYVPDYRVAMFRALSRIQGVQLDVIHSTGYLSEPDKPGTSKVICERARQVMGFQIPLGPFKLIFQPRALFLAVQNRYDIIVCQGGRSTVTSALMLLWSKMTGVLFLWWTGSWEPTTGPPWARKLLQRYQRLLWANADGAVVYNREARAKLASIGLPKHRIVIAQNTRNEKMVVDNLAALEKRANEIRSRMGIGPQEPIILFVGALIPEKRVEILIRSFAILSSIHPDWHLVIVGDGQQRRQLEALSQKLRLPRVTFTGRIIEDVYGYFCMCDIFVLPALGGLAINDAMMCRKPVICGQADGTEKDLIIDGKTGKLFNTSSPNAIEDLGRLIEQLLMDPQRCRQMGQNAFEHYMRTASFSMMIDSFARALKMKTYRQ